MIADAPVPRIQPAQTIDIIIRYAPANGRVELMAPPMDPRMMTMILLDTARATVAQMASQGSDGQGRIVIPGRA